MEVGTASATSLSGDATATVTGNITSDFILFDGIFGATGDNVTVASAATANATSGTATATATAGNMPKMCVQR